MIFWYVCFITKLPKSGTDVATHFDNLCVGGKHYFNGRKLNIVVALEGLLNFSLSLQYYSCLIFSFKWAKSKLYLIMAGIILCVGAKSFIVNCLLKQVLILGQQS